MPELPEVETMVRDLRAQVVGRTVTRVEAEFPGSVAWPSFDAFVAEVTGLEITQVSRRGKFAILSLSSLDLLILHRGMSGSVLLRASSAPMESHVRVVFVLNDGRELRFNDPRKFGRIYLWSPSDGIRSLPWEHMGPEPLDDDFSPGSLQQALNGRTGLIKPLLLNQRLVSGLGNIYVDEALHLARLHPGRRANTLTRTDIRRLHHAIQQVLASALERRGTTFSTYVDIEGRQGAYQNALRVFQRQGSACPRCGANIVKIVVGGRGTHVCPRCQKA